MYTFDFSQNDDEEERRRRRTVFNESIVSFNSELEHNESLRYAVQLYTDNVCWEMS